MKSGTLGLHAQLPGDPPGRVGFTYFTTEGEIGQFCHLPRESDQSLTVQLVVLYAALADGPDSKDVAGGQHREQWLKPLTAHQSAAPIIDGTAILEMLARAKKSGKELPANAGPLASVLRAIKRKNE
jgi:hypothetical protein